jgi:hypothetical protein
MDEFIAAQVKSLERTAGVRMPWPADCMIVAKLAPRSLAAHAGVAVKDFLVALDGKAAGTLAPQTHLYRSAEHRWTFYSRARHELIELHASGIEPGVALQPTLDGIKERYDPRRGSPKDLEYVWEARDWAALERLSAVTLKAMGRDRDTPALAFLGAALFESGRKADGLKLVAEFEKLYAPHWTMNFRGVALYYLALAQLDGQDREAGLALLRSAFEHNDGPRLADALEKHTGVRPPPQAPLWLGQTFPADYTLPLLESPGQTLSLDRTLQGLRDGRLLCLCLLDGYRGNGPYNDFMLSYLNFATWFTPFLGGLHVITMEPERRADRAHYFLGEDAVRAAGLPLELLLEDGALSALVNQTSSPFLLLLDGARRVRFEGELDAVALWNTIAELEAGPAN